MAQHNVAHDQHLLWDLAVLACTWLCGFPIFLSHLSFISLQERKPSVSNLAGIGGPELLSTISSASGTASDLHSC